MFTHEPQKCNKKVIVSQILFIIPSQTAVNSFILFIFFFTFHISHMVKNKLFCKTNVFFILFLFQSYEIWIKSKICVPYFLDLTIVLFQMRAEGGSQVIQYTGGQPISTYSTQGTVYPNIKYTGGNLSVYTVHKVQFIQI